MAVWSGHVSYFGSPAAYAKAIKEKESKGQSLSDPAAAAAFKAANPQYFGGGSYGGSSGSGGGSSGGSSSGGGSRGSSPSRTYSLPNYDTWSNMSHEQRVAELNKAGIDVGDWSNMSHEQRMSYLGGGSSGGSSGSRNSLSGMVPIRSSIENLYGQGSVSYDPQTGAITLYNPYTNRTETIARNAYTEQGGTAYINPDYIKSWLDIGAESPSGRLPTDTTAGGYGGGWGGVLEYSANPEFVVSVNPATGQMQASGYIEQTKLPTGDVVYTKTEKPLSELLPYISQAQPKYLQDQVQNILDQVQQAYTPDASLAPLYSKALDQMLATIDTYQQQLTDQIKQQMGGVDPATQAALANLKETVKRQRDAMLEEMSRRGLLQSGLWVEAEDRLNRGELTAQQQLLATRLSALQDQLNQALQNFGNLRLQAMQTYGLKGIEQLTEEAKQRREALQKSLEQALDQAYKQRQLDIQQWQAQAPYMYGTWEQRNQLPQDWAKTTGTVPAGPGYEPVPVRDYVGSRGSVSYDPNTGNVLINGKPINPSAVGGLITPEGVAYIPRNIIEEALRRY